jgi:hypothetical protein
MTKKEAVSEAEQRRRDQMIQEVRDAEMAPQLEDAYNRSLRSPEMVKPREKKKEDKKAAGGKVKTYAAGGSASKRADGCAVKGKTRGKMV